MFAPCELVKQTTGQIQCKQSDTECCCTCELGKQKIGQSAARTDQQHPALSEKPISDVPLHALEQA